MDRRLVLEFVRVTESAAIACSHLVGHGEKDEADARAVGAMRDAFDRVPIRGTVVIGEGERDEAPMLYIGEQVGPGRDDLPEVDIAVDPLEGTNLCAEGRPGAMAVLAVAARGKLLNAPDTYMDKIITGPEGHGVVSLKKSPTENVNALAEAKGRKASEITVVVLERDRHEDLVVELRKAGARVYLISDGDVAPSVATCMPDSGIDMVYGTGGAPEGVLAAAALHCLGGCFKGRLNFRNEGERERAISMGMENPEMYLELDDLVRGEVIFVATGVTTGPLLKGVRRIGDRLFLQSLAMRSTTGTVRWVETSVRAGRFEMYAKKS
ncbi:MAG: class II fructose-bisphosphatase [Myxococcales bacterium]|nr:class II fructose-bisphosphatase [Myxococcales bacterium]MCB9715606.1 class II fructose-bisphosphatase [Myxococcales bacterium]